MKMRIGIFKGDYIGPEITNEAVKVLRAVAFKYGHEVEIVPLEASGEAYDKYGVHLPVHSLREAESCGAILKGPFGGPPEELNHPKWSGVEREAILPLRKYFNLFMNLRETRVMDSLLDLSPIKAEHIKDVNFIIVRELSSGMYFGPKLERVIDGEREYSDTEAYRESEIYRIAVRAFEIARLRRRKVTLIAKSNVLKSSLLWREVVAEVAKSYSDVLCDYLHVDNAAMQLILNPRQFDVVLTSNMFGDILSDEASALVGSIGLFPSASLGDGSFGLYEPIHGSAPSIAGKNQANPISSILCVALMFRFSFGLESEAQRVENAVHEVLANGLRTIDLVSDSSDRHHALGTIEMGDRIVATIMKDTQ